MASPFPQSVQALSLDRGRTALVGVAVALCALGIAFGWASWAQIGVYAATDTARLEAFAAPHALQSPAAGRVLETHLELGRAIHAGEALLVLDAERERLELEEARRRLEGYPVQITSLRAQRAALEESLRAARGRSQVTLEQAGARGREAAAALHAKTDELERLSRIPPDQIPERDLVRLRDEKRGLQAVSEAREIEQSRLGWELKNEEARTHLRLEEVGRELGELEGRLATQKASIGRLVHEVDRRVVRAPVDGTLAAVPELQVGAYLKEGDALGTIVPSGKLRVVAQFSPAAALGRVRPSQPARLRLHGFPWPQFSPVEAVVSSVAMEPRSGEVRVELAVSVGPRHEVTLEHGLPGTLEVEVERTSPLSLALRAAGRALHGTPSTEP